MILRLLVAVCIILAALAAVRLVSASTDHIAGSCPAQSWASQSGPTELWWKAITACNDHQASELQHAIYVQVYDWDGAVTCEPETLPCWRDTTGIAVFSGSNYESWFLATSRYRQVTPYQGLACYRIRTHHFIVEPQKGLMSDGNSYSTQHCY